MKESNATHSSAFIPTWLDDAGLSQAEFRLYCHLCRRADYQTGIAWPSYDSMAIITGASKRTLRRSIEELERRDLIKKAGKPFGGSCRYRILAIVPSEIPLSDSNSVTTDTIEAPPIVPLGNCNSIPHGTSIVPSGIREGSPSKVLQLRFSNSCALEIFEAYPRKDAKKPALAAIEKALKQNTAEHLLERTKLFAEASKGKESRFIPHGATFFNQERFNDDPETWKPGKQGKTCGSGPSGTLTDEELQIQLGGRYRIPKRAGEYPEPQIQQLPRL